MYSLRIGNPSGGWTEFPLTAPAARPELLKISPDGCLKEDESYQLRLVTNSDDSITDISVIVDGEEVAKGLAEGSSSYHDSNGELLHVYTPTLLGRSGADGQILLLIYGFARIEVSLALASGDTLSLESDDIPILVRGDRESETARVEGMFDALFSAPPSRPLQWMLTGTPSYNERFSIVEGGTTSPASRSVSTFLQITDQVLSGFEQFLPSFRSHVRSSIHGVPARVPGNKVRVASAREARWIASHPQVLQRSRVESGIKMGSGFYMPRYVQTEQKARSYDTYENRTIVSFLSACGQRLGRLSSLIESEQGLGESVETALNPFSAEGYVLSSLLIATSSMRRGEAVRERAESLRRKAASLEHAYQLAAPGVNPDRFLPPRRSKVFQEVAPYTKLYELMMRWCTMGDLDMRGSLLALRTARMDRFYEYYVLLAILSKLDQHGFRPSNAVEPPIEVVEYSLAKTSRYFRNEGQVANKIVLDGKTGTVALYYQPVIYGDDREENGIRLHRTSVGASGHDSYYTPDFLIIFRGEGGSKTVVVDAKYRYTRAVMEDSPDSEFRKCLRKYRQEVSSVFGPPDAVWLLCGRDTEVENRYWEQSTWAQSTTGFIRSGAMTLTPMGDNLEALLETLGIIRRPTESDATPDEADNRDGDYQPDHDAETAEVFSEYDDCHGAGASPIESEAAVDSDLNASSDQAPAARQNGIPKDCEAIASKPTDDSVAALDERSDDCEGAASEDEVPPGAETFTHAHIEAVEAQAKATEEQASNVPKPRAGSKGKRAARGDSPTRAGNLVRQIAELLGQNESLLFDDGWSRDNLGLGRPALRASRPTGKEAGRYVPYTLNGGDLFLAKDWTPLNINKANQLIRRLSK